MHAIGSIRSLGLLFGCLLLVGCSGSRGDRLATSTTEVDAPSREEMLARLADAETFDVSGYPDDPPPESIDINHQVPEKLMEGRADAGVVGRQRGYRIQLVFARDKATADDSVEAFIGWWEAMQTENPDAPLFQREPPVYTTYRQPYYRVRIGDFAEKEAAENLLALVKESYPQAFVVIDVVNFQR